VLSAFLLKTVVALLPALVFYTYSILLTSLFGVESTLPGNPSQVLLAMVSAILLLSLPSLPVILVVTAYQPKSNWSAGVIGLAVGAIGGLSLALLISMVTGQANMRSIVSASVTEATVGIYVGLVTMWLNGKFKKSLGAKP